MRRYCETERCPKCGGLLRHRRWVVDPPGRLLAVCAGCGFETERSPWDAEEITGPGSLPPAPAE